MPKLTVLIPCKDERLNIRDCIASVRSIADEILVADSGSTDETLDIVRSLGGCRIIERDFVTPADFKNWALDYATYDWVLAVDADERVTPELAQEIEELLADCPDCDAYSMRRENYFLGYRIRHCGWGDQHPIVRLFRRSVCRFDDRRVHEKIEIADQSVGALAHPLEHYTAWDLDSFVGKQNRYSTWAADDMHDGGRHHGLFRMLLRGPLRFMQLYFLRGGILDGVPGLIVCSVMAHYAFLKSSKLWSLHHGQLPTLDPLPKSAKSWDPITIPMRRPVAHRLAA